MATVIQIKRSSGSAAPTTGDLAEGELAYSQDAANDGASGILYIESVDSGSAAVIQKIGGKYYTDTVDEFLTQAGAAAGGILTLQEGTGNGTNKVQLKAPASITSDVAFVLPGTDGSNGNVLTTDGSGNLSFTSPAASSFTLAGDSGSDTFNTGETLTFTGGEGIDTAITNNTVTISAENASTTNKGVASFNSTNFTVSSGAVSLNSVELTKLNIAGGTVATTLADTDEFIIYDAGATANRAITAENVADYIYAGVSGDILIAEDGTATLQANAIALGTDTTGNYVATATGGTGINISGSGSESAAITVSIDSTVATLTGAQTLTNKTISGASNTLSNIANSSLTNSSITINGTGVSLGGSITLDTGDIGESGNLYHTTERVQDVVGGQFVTNGSHTGISFSYDDAGDGAIDATVSLASFSTTNLSEGTNLYFTNARARSAISVTDSGGDGSLSYNSGTGVITYVGPSAAEVRAHFSGGTGVSIASGVISIGQAVATTSDVTFNDVTVDGDLILGGNTIKSSGGTTAITVSGANVTVAGNLTVSGSTTTVESTTVTVTDPLLLLAKDNNTTDAVDIGFYGLYDTSGSTDLYAGLFRDATDGKFRLFKDLQTAPTSTVNTAGTGYAVASLVANLEGNVTGSLSGGTVSSLSSAIAVGDGGTGATTFTSNGVLYGNGTSAVQATAAGTDGYFLYSNSGTPAWTNTIDGGTY